MENPGQADKTPSNLFYKLLDVSSKNNKLVQLREGIPDETFIE